MSMKKEKTNYNDRLFRTGRIRHYYHMARFLFVSEVIEKKNIDVSRFLELGCFDGRLLGHIPTTDFYVGVDANVEGGLDLAKAKFAGDDSKLLIESQSPKDLENFEEMFFTAFASLETCEHIDPNDLDSYFEQAARILCGDVLITVPNEKGPVLLIKQIAKRMIGSRSEPYSASELYNAAIGRMDRVNRREHKGFDFEELISQLEQRFDIISVTGLPFRWLPPILNLTVAVHARSRKPASNNHG